MVGLLTAALLVAASATSETRVLTSRDDFACYNSTFGTPMTVKWASAVLDNNGNVHQINIVDTVSEVGRVAYLYQYNRFDHRGRPLASTTSFLPIQQDSIRWTPGSLAECQVNDSNGDVFALLMIKPVSRDNSEIPALIVIDTPNGNGSSAVCLTRDDPMRELFFDAFPRGNVNDSGVIGLCWARSPRSPSLPPAIIARLYRPQFETLTSPINVLHSLSLPSELDPPGHIKIVGTPDLKVARDGSFVAVWMVRLPTQQGMRTFAFFSLYNADGTLRRAATSCTGADGEPDSHFDRESQPYDIDLAAEPDGDFYVTWAAHANTPGADIRDHVWVSAFNADGSPKYGPIRLNDSDSLWLMLGDEISPRISCDSAGDVLVCWSDSRDFPGDIEDKSRNLYAQAVDCTGQLIGANHRMNNVGGSLSGASKPSCDMNDLGQVIVCWQNEPPARPRIAAQLMPWGSIGGFPPGDINYDLTFDIKDLTSLAGNLFFNTRHTFWPRNLADVNRDSINGDRADLEFLAACLFAHGPAPAVPDPGIRPNPGRADPTVHQ